MKTLTTIVENWNNGKLDKSVKEPERERVKNAIYDKLDETSVTGHYYRDNSWEGVRQVKSVLNDVLAQLSKKLRKGTKYEISIAPDEGGYRKSKDGMSQWKQYKVEIYKVPAEYDDYPEPFMLGTLNCHAAGSVKDPFDAYDMSFCI